LVDKLCRCKERCNRPALDLTDTFPATTEFESAKSTNSSVSAFTGSGGSPIEMGGRTCQRATTSTPSLLGAIVTAIQAAKIPYMVNSE